MYSMSSGPFLFWRRNVRVPGQQLFAGSKFNSRRMCVRFWLQTYLRFCIFMYEVTHKLNSDGVIDSIKSLFGSKKNRKKQSKMLQQAPSSTNMFPPLPYAQTRPQMPFGPPQQFQYGPAPQPQPMLRTPFAPQPMQQYGMPFARQQTVVPQPYPQGMIQNQTPMYPMRMGKGKGDELNDYLI